MCHHAFAHSKWFERFSSRFFFFVRCAFLPTTCVGSADMSSMTIYKSGKMFSIHIDDAKKVTKKIVKNVPAILRRLTPFCSSHSYVGGDSAMSPLNRVLRRVHMKIMHAQLTRKKQFFFSNLQMLFYLFLLQRYDATTLYDNDILMNEHSAIYSPSKRVQKRVDACDE